MQMILISIGVCRCSRWSSRNLLAGMFSTKHNSKSDMHTSSLAPAGGGERAFPPLEIGTKNQIFLENVKSTA